MHLADYPRLNMVIDFVPGFVNQLLSWRPLIPLSRLTYMAYLIHPIIMLTYYLSRQSTIFLDDLQAVCICIHSYSSHDTCLHAKTLINFLKYLSIGCHLRFDY